MNVFIIFFFYLPLTYYLKKALGCKSIKKEKHFSYAFLVYTFRFLDAQTKRLLDKTSPHKCINKTSPRQNVYSKKSPQQMSPTENVSRTKRLLDKTSPHKMFLNKTSPRQNVYSKKVSSTNVFRRKRLPHKTTPQQNASA
jgi:hypothetical protein